MSEIRDKVIKQALEIMHEKEADLLGEDTQIWLERKIERILSIPELAIVDRDAELPTWKDHVVVDPFSYRKAQEDMAGYVLEVKE